MIFKQWRQVLNGTKTQTRRLVRPDDYTWVNGLATVAGGMPPSIVITEVCGISPSGRHYLKWAVGKTYTVQPGRGKKAVGRIRITKIRRERLGDISGEDSMAEGIILVPYEAYMCPVCHKAYEWPQEAYACLWNCCGGRWEQDQNDDVWVLGFESGPGL